jgi:hypothetical protein
MTDEEFEIMADKWFWDDISLSVIRLALDKWNSGAIDKTRYEVGDYLPVRACLSSALKEVATRFRPLSDEGKELAVNLSHF